MSLLDLSLLGLLADQPLHGYELSKRLRSQGRGAVSFGALYPALGRLDRKGFITSASADDQTTAPAPMTGSLGAEVARLRRGTAHSAPRSKRKRKVYTITAAGRRRLEELLTTPAEDDRTFSTQMAAASHLDQRQRLELFEHRRRMLADRLNEDTPGLVDRYRSALRDRDRMADAAEVEWLDHLLAAERNDGARPDTPPTALSPADALVGSMPSVDNLVDVDPPVDTTVDAIPRTVGGSIR